MGIENFSESILLVTLPKEPQLQEELETAYEIICNKGNCDVVVDFSEVEMLTSANICNLMILSKLLCGLHHQLILCNVSLSVKALFTLTGLESLFEFADDKDTAIESLQSVCLAK